MRLFMFMNESKVVLLILFIMIFFLVSVLKRGSVRKNKMMVKIKEIFISSNEWFVNWLIIDILFVFMVFWMLIFFVWFKVLVMVRLMKLIFVINKMNKVINEKMWM